MLNRVMIILTVVLLAVFGVSLSNNEPAEATQPGFICEPLDSGKIDTVGAQDVVNIARLNGLPVVALCGYTWVPVHNPEKFDACESCIQIAGELMRGAGE